MTDGVVLDDIERELKRGEYLRAFDIAHEAADAADDDLLVRYYAILALARAGASDRAAEELARSGILDRLDAAASPELAEDVAALNARLIKDRALRSTGDRGVDLARQAAEAYEAIYNDLQRPYSCINAATMWLLAGDVQRSRLLATAARALITSTPHDRRTYWDSATLAEAALLLNKMPAAVDALTDAAAKAQDDVSARASTRRQLRLVCERTGIDSAVLDHLPVPQVVHFCGHRISGPDGNFPAAHEERVRREVTEYVQRQGVGFAYGSLASGADTIVAEAVLDAGAELHIFLPFRRAEFVDTSVAPAGKDWVRRFHRCLDRATSVTSTDDGPFLDDDTLFEYCSSVAMGRALIRSDHLTAPVEQLAIWDGRPNGAHAGTAADVAAWHASGGRTHVVQAAPAIEPRKTVPGARSKNVRTIRAMLFADVRGFSALDDGHMPAFTREVLDPIARVLADFGHDVHNRRTWGDAIHVVFSGAVPAARCALALQEAMRDIDWKAVGFPGPIELRIGAHAGPVLPIFDPVRGAPDYTGVHIVRTARIEPRTPPGEVYVTEQFAALVALESDDSFTCEYVGHLPSAKDYGTFPMYVVRRTAQY